MKICAFTIENRLVDLLFTEVRFDIASARASCCEVICFEADASGDERAKLITHITKHFKALKKEGKIDFFATHTDFEKESATASYLINKIPNLQEKISNEKLLFIVKL